MSAKITKKFNVSTNREALRITSREDVISMKELKENTEIQFKSYVRQDVLNEQTGEEFESILVLAEDGKLYATRSETFIRKLDGILEQLYEVDESGQLVQVDDEPIIIRITHQRSAKGNEYASCCLA